jgi:RNA polymerase sigma factor (sigma-70 family)
LQKPSAYQHLSDQELLSLFYEVKDVQLLGHLLQRYTLLLYGVCYKYLKDEEAAKDGVQHIFLKALQELPRYEVTYLKSWLYMVAKNHCLMYLRDHNRHVPEDLMEPLSATLPYEDDGERRHEKEQLLQQIEDGLQKLNDEQRTCVTLFYLHHNSYQQICEATGFSLLQVKSFIQNGKRNIKLWVEKRRADENSR